MQLGVLWLENYGKQASNTCSHGVTNQHKVIGLGFVKHAAILIISCGTKIILDGLISGDIIPDGLRRLFRGCPDSPVSAELHEHCASFPTKDFEVSTWLQMHFLFLFFGICRAIICMKTS